MKLLIPTGIRLSLFAALVAICAAGQHTRPAAATPSSFSDSTALAFTGMMAKTSTITVSGLTGTVTHVRVKLLGLTDASISGVLVDLHSAHGSGNARLLEGVDGAASGADLTFDDNQLVPVPTGPTTGTYHATANDAPPSGVEASMAGFNGSDPNGDWTLTYVDSVSGGTIAGGWALEITTSTSTDAAPVVNSISDQDFGMTGMINVSGSFTDSDSTIFLGQVDYGDGGGFEALPLTGMNFTLAHTYDPAGGPFTATVNIYDDDGKVGTASFIAHGANSAPSSVMVTPSSGTINENDSVSLTGSFTDPDAGDTHTVLVTWGDGGTSSFSLAAGVTSFGGQPELTHQRTWITRREMPLTPLR